MNRNTKNFILSLILTSLMWLALPGSCNAQTCRTWWQALASSFFPKKVDAEMLREFAQFSPEDYQSWVTKLESKMIESSEAGQLSNPQAEARLRSALRRFYAVGYQLFGVRLDPNKLIINSATDVNAHASGSIITFNQGTLDYFQNDWNSIYFVLAHEASHNLMRHIDGAALSYVMDSFKEYRQSEIDYRNDLAKGRKGGGDKRYLRKFGMNFLQEFESSTQSRERESEADAVALLVLQRAGLNPAIGLTASQKMALLTQPRRGVQSGITEVLCSTHPEWITRIQEIQANLSCLQFSGRLCRRHLPYLVEERLNQLHDQMTQLDEYHRESLRIAGTTEDNPAPNREGEIKAAQETPIKSLTKEQREQFEKIEKARKALGDMTKYYNEGNTLFRNKQYEEALAQYKSAAEIDPMQHAVFAKLAETYFQLRQFDNALANYQKAISLLEAQTEQKADTKQNLASYYNNYGGVLAKAGKTKEAIDIYKKAATINPERAGMYYFNMGAVLTNSRAPLEDCIDAFKKATEVDPKNANAWYRYGLMLSEKMRLTPDGKVVAPSGMVEALQKYLELAPDGPYAARTRGLISAARGTPVKR